MSTLSSGTSRLSLFTRFDWIWLGVSGPTALRLETIATMSLWRGVLGEAVRRREVFAALLSLAASLGVGFDSGDSPGFSWFFVNFLLFGVAGPRLGLVFLAMIGLAPSR